MEELSGVSFIRALIPQNPLSAWDQVSGTHGTLITSQRPQLQISSYCGLRLQPLNINYEGTQTLNP